MKFIVKSLLLLVALGALGLVGYAFLADLTPEQIDVTLPVQLNVD